MPARSQPEKWTGNLMPDSLADPHGRAVAKIVLSPRNPLCQSGKA
jgi:hypothetical protein